MANILIVTFAGGGNFPPAVAVGHELCRRGHRVRVLGHESQRATTEAAQLGFAAYRRSPRWTPHEELSTSTVLRMLLAMTTSEGVAHDVRDEIRCERTDLVIVDCMLFSALAATAEAGVCHAVLFHSFFSVFDGSFRHGPAGIAARVRGFGPKRLWENANMLLVCSDPLLDPAARSRNEAPVWTGAIHDATAAAVGRTPPRILVSLSTGGFPGQRRAYQNILDAASSMDVELTVTTGPAIDPAGLRVPENATVHRYVPHNRIMPDCSVVVGHGGHATAFRALAHSLPMLVMPLSVLTDQAVIGKTVASTGSGISIRKTAPPDKIRMALDDLLRTERYRTAASALGARLRTTDGASAAADRLLSLLEH